MLSIRAIVALVLVGISAVSSFPAAAEEKPEELARQAALAWLDLCDAGKYAESHEQAALYFRNATTADDWQRSLHAVRDPLGHVLSRKLKSATYTKALPGAPDGEYVVIQFDTAFEHKASAIETVTPERESDGKWRVAGYFIK